ncbi:MAG: GntR family transcriptional regulator [Acidimicrobiia bacterium]|nr:MAG: GntR family transcriptional regulator [Acidimicrobiia bacterium]
MMRSRFARDPLTYAEPLYQRAIEAVIEFIGDQRYQPGGRLPSENDLAAELGISRPTLREALTELQTQGVIERRRGVGTFVAEEKPASLRPGIERLRSFRSLSQSAGVSFARSSWSVQEAFADEDVASALGVRLGEPVVYVRTTATASEIPAATFGTYILPKYVNVDRLRAYSSGSLLDFVIEAGSPKLHHTNTELSATDASGSVSVWLDVPDGTPVLGLAEIFFDRSGRSVMYSRNYFLTTQVSFNLVRTVD